MAQFVSRYIESNATITEPLRKLTRKSQPWRRRKAEGGAFKKLKEALTKVGVTAYFDPKKQTDILIDASRDATSQDGQLQAVLTAITTGKWTGNLLLTFKTLKDELSTHDGVILRQNRIVIPKVLQKQVVKLTHASHQGVVKTKQLIREKAWFPGIHKIIEDHLKGCLPCQASVNTPKQSDPLHRSPFPICPWDELSVDFARPFPTGEHLLIVIDDYSRFPEVEIVNSTSARSVTPKLNQIFARFGTPNILKSDNGSPFNREEFASFAKKLGFHHRKITPLWPKANGEAERSVRSLDKFVHTCKAERSNRKQELPNFLRQYRATPHSSTKISPHEALTVRKMRTTLPELVTTQKRQRREYNQQ
ncbi:transposon ty3-g Gag-Pol polyprotein [Plakobranchus ocellatus]|uniref:Transposon ty3-g Gag-Pol polyprotein n=1 Tax=Plakobranchus ocellatus TaxID=259542 RepID=A0AAV3Y594_9GAST|nr:transposon ty3-g Gag-Pol polyprotein [Plakobranchus ocellatus]